jgi:protein-tyrosine phosphatase
MTRDLDFEAIINFRDFGLGRRAGDRTVRAGRLFRSGHHGESTDADLARLAGFDFALAIDLRRPPERLRDPARRPASWRAAVLEHGGEAGESLPPHLAFLTDPDASESWISERMREGYRGYPFDPNYLDLYRRYFAHLPKADGPVLISCHAGKDRTGVLCALTLHLLGVSRVEIYDDYLLTNVHNRADQRAASLARQFEVDHGRPVPESLLRHVMAADATYLDAAMEAIEARHGDLDTYLAEVLGVTAERRALIRDRYLD